MERWSGESVSRLVGIVLLDLYVLKSYDLLVGIDFRKVFIRFYHSSNTLSEAHVLIAKENFLFSLGFCYTQELCKNIWQLLDYQEYVDECNRSW